MIEIEDILNSFSQVSGSEMNSAIANTDVLGAETFNERREEETPYPDSMSDPIEVAPVSPDNQPINDEVVRVTTARFSGAVWYEKIQEQVICVGGQGGISSWFTFLAARMHPRSIYTYDPDRVERVNLAGQLFCSDDVGMYKGEAISRTITKYSEYRSMFSINERYTAVDGMQCKIMVCGFDNMTARREFYSRWKSLVFSLPEEERSQCLFIDGRLAAETLQVFCIVGTSLWDMENYEKNYMFSDEEAEEAVCSLKQTAYMANIIGGIMNNLLVNFCANLCGGCRTIPFYTSYEADQMYLKLEGGI